MLNTQNMCLRSVKIFRIIVNFFDIVSRINYTNKLYVALNREINSLTIFDVFSAILSSDASDFARFVTDLDP